MQKQCIDGERIFTIPEFFTLDECASAIARSERAGYAEATITSPVGVVMDKSIRDNARLIVDDSALAATLWQRLQPFLPASIDQWRPYRRLADDRRVEDEDALVSRRERR